MSRPTMLRPGFLTALAAMTPGLLLWIAVPSSALQVEDAATQVSPPEGEAGDDFVNLADTIPTLVIDLAYAGEKNFFQKKFYPRNACFLRRSTAEKLRKVQTTLQREGYGLKVFDGYRPLSVQRAMWKIKPDPTYVADPRRGSRHNRGAAIDVTLVDKHGKEVAMPTGFDDFTPKAASDYAKLSKEVLTNRKRLQSAMTRHGFRILPSEWWHFDDMGWKKFPVMDVSIEELLGKGGREEN